MIRMAVQQPGAAITGLFATAFSLRGLKFLAAYLALVVIGGIAFGSTMVGAGFEKGLSLDLAFYALMALALLILVTPAVVASFGHVQADTHGSARFATKKEVTPLTRADSGLLIGRDDKTGKLLRYNGHAHLLTMAPTRSGKGVGVVIPNLLNWPDSVVVLDIKGENYDITAGYRAAHGQAVYAFSPFDEDACSHRWNPLTAVRSSPLHRVGDLLTIGQVLSLIHI